MRYSLDASAGKVVGRVLRLALALRLAWLAVAILGIPWQIEPGRFGHLDAQGRGYLFTPHAWLDMWLRWDGDFYARIAATGYGDGLGSLRQAFFPLFPLSVRALCALSGWASPWAALLLGNLYSVLAWLALAFYWRARLPAARLWPTFAAFLLFPSRNFEFSAYSEGLFVLLSVVSFAAWERRRFGLAALGCALVSATRPQGIFVGAALGGEALLRVWRRQPAAAALAAAAAGLLGIGSYMVFLQARYGDALAFVHLQRVWKRSLSLPFSTLRAHGEPLNHLVLWAALALFVYMLRRRAPLRECLYVGLSLAAPLLSGSVQSLPRFVGVLFPLWTFAGGMLPAAGARAPVWQRCYWPLAVGFSLLMAFKVGQGGRVV